MRVLIATDDERSARQAGEILGRNGVERETCHTVGLELTADRASRLSPELLVLILPSDPAAGLEALHETCQTVRNAHVLVVGPATDAKLVLATLHEGANEYLDENSLESELPEALSRLKAKQIATPDLDQPGAVICVMGASGGAGSSTVAVNISADLARRYGTAGLIDLRLSAGDLAPMLDVQPRYTIVDLCDRLSRVDQSMFEQFLAPHQSGVHLLAAPYEFTHIDRITDKGVRRVLAMARVRFPYVVVEVENAFEPEQVEALWQADVILMVLRLDYTSVRNTRRAIDNLTALGIGSERIQIVANGYRLRSQLSIGQAEAALGMKIRHYIPNDPARVNHAINKGIPLVVLRPSAKVSRAIVDLAASVNGRQTHSTKQTSSST